jgi:hypothetical protein
MSDALVPPAGGRGTDLLLAHCAALTRLDDARAPASERLEHALGGDLARMLVLALASRRTRSVELAA